MTDDDLLSEVIGYLCDVPLFPGARIADLERLRVRLAAAEAVVTAARAFVDADDAILSADDLATLAAAQAERNDVAMPRLRAALAAAFAATEVTT